MFSYIQGGEKKDLLEREPTNTNQLKKKKRKNDRLQWDRYGKRNPSWKIYSEPEAGGGLLDGTYIYIYIYIKILYV